MFKSKLKNLDLNNKRVFLRADLNVPLKEGKIIQEYKLNSILPTINKILNKGGKVILATHIGRPKDQEEILSTKIDREKVLKDGKQVLYIGQRAMDVAMLNDPSGSILARIRSEQPEALQG